MGAPLSPAEQAALDAKLTATPASIDDTIPGSPVFIPQSGLTLDITDVTNQITNVQTDLAGPIPDELSMQTTTINYYHTLLRGYENEEILLNGEYEAIPYETIEATTEPLNVYKKLDPAIGPFTRYFPTGASGLIIQSFPEELFQGAKLVNPAHVSNIKLDLIESSMFTFQDESVQDATGSGWTDAEIISGIVDPVVPIDPPQDVTNQAIFDAQKLAIDNAINDMITQATNLSLYLDLYTSAPFDLENPTAQADAIAFQVIVDLFITYLNTTLANPYITSVYTNFSTTINPTFKTDRDNRKTSILTLKKSDLPLNPFYEIRKQIGIELADLGEGLVYKKLAAEANVAQLQDRKAKLERKLATYQAL